MGNKWQTPHVARKIYPELHVPDHSEIHHGKVCAWNQGAVAVEIGGGWETTPWWSLRLIITVPRRCCFCCCCPLALLCNSRQTAAGDCCCFLPASNDERARIKWDREEQILRVCPSHLPQTCFLVEIRISSWRLCSLIIQGVFLHWASRTKLKYGKPRLGESTLT